MAWQHKYYRMLARSLIANANCICGAIERYLAKADDDLEKTLAAEGYAEAKGTVSAINDMEEGVTAALQSQTEDLISALESSKGGGWKKAKKKIYEMLEDDDIADQITGISEEMLNEEIPKLATAYIKETDGELVVDSIRRSTSEWIASWSQRLGELMRINSHQQITSLIQSNIDNGEDIASLTRKILEGGWRSEYYQAKRVAVTEVLRAHSVAAEEAIQQSPAVTLKEWRHTGGHKNNPRPNHVDMDRQIVQKDQPFVLYGADGNTYYPMYPRDPLLPAAESVNCHCIHRGIADESILGLSYDERKKMQEAILAEENGNEDYAGNASWSSYHRTNMTAQYQAKAAPGKGKVTYGEGYKKGRHQNEIDTANWIHGKYGGDIRLVPESNELGKKTPDFNWNGKDWELKNVTSVKSADSAVRSALKQIKDNPGGVILDYGDSQIDMNELRNTLESRVKRTGISSIDIMVLRNNKEKPYIYRYKK